MTDREYVRLRQICLAAPVLAPVEGALSSILGIRPCHRSDGVGQFGLENVVFAVNGSFIEIVAPIRAGTSVDRFLARNEGRGGYMAIFDCGDLGPVRSAVGDRGIRIAYSDRREDVELLQLHPADIGGAILEIDRHTGGEDRFGRYAWGGPSWQREVETGTTVDLLGIGIAGTPVRALAEKWQGVLPGSRLAMDGDAAVLDLDYGYIRFTADETLANALFTEAHLSVRDPAAVLKAARSHGCRTTADGFRAMGVDFLLSSAP